MMFKCSICALLVIPILFVNSEDYNSISTTVKVTKSNKTYSCQHEGDIEMVDGDELTVKVTHIYYINFVLLTNPTEKQVEVSKDVTGNDKKVVAKYNVSVKQTGKWIFETLTAENVTNVENHKYIIYKGSGYHVEQCVFDIIVNGRDGSWIDNWVYWALIGFGLLTIIIVIQTFVICRILKKKKVRRIEQLAISNRSRSGCDTARYSTTPGRKLSKAKADDDCDSIYESLDEIQSGNAAPPPPPLETLPRPPKKDKVPLIPGNSSQHSTPSRNPVTEEDRLKCRPQLPLPFEVNGASPPIQPGHSETLTRTAPESSLRGTNKVKRPPICSPSKIPPSPDRPAPTMPKKLPVNQDPLANELNNILKRRQTGTGNTGGVAPKLVKPEKPEAIPETKPKPAPEQGLKPPTFAKPTTPMTPAKQFPKPMGSTTVGTLPKNTSISPTQQPLIPTPAPKPAVVRKWPPVNTQLVFPKSPSTPSTGRLGVLFYSTGNHTGTQSQAHPSNAPPRPMHAPHPTQPQAQPGLGRGHPMHRPAHPTPHPVHPTQQHQRKLPPLPVQPSDEPEEEAVYNEYEQYGEQEEDENFQEDYDFEEDDEDWTYEVLPQYNIYSNTDEIARVSSP